jgi:predicted dehydrogenase
MKEIKIGIIGCGKIVESNHLPALMNIEDVTISWVFDKNEARASLVAEMYNLKPIGEAVLKTQLANIDICLLAVPYGVRSDYIRLCADLGKALYVEKPFATTAKEHSTFCDLFPPYKLAVGFQRRYYKSVQDLKAIIDQEIFGKLRSVKFSQGYFQLKGGTGFISDAAMSGGGVIIESAIHTLDQILQFTEAEDVQVKEARAIYKNGIDYDTHFSGSLNSRKGTVDYTCHISCLRNLDNGLVLQFDNATLQLMPGPAPEIMIKTASGNIQVSHLPLRGNAAENVNKAFVLLWSDFITALRKQESNTTSGVSSMLTSVWIENIYKRINNN